MRTIERNFRKNPHTARFLMAFHAGTNGLPSDIDENAAEYELAQGDGADLLDLVPAEAPAFTQSAAQVKFIVDLVQAISALDAELGGEAASYTGRMQREGAWTRENTSRWIERLIAKRDELRAAARRAPAPVAVPVGPSTESKIPANNYGITKDGEVKCYEVSYGKAGTKWEGFTFLNRISSDDRHAIRNAAEKAAILIAIAVDVDAARILAATTLRQCSRCHRTLSDTKNPYFSIGLGPDCGSR